MSIIVIVKKTIPIYLHQPSVLAVMFTVPPDFGTSPTTLTLSTDNAGMKTLKGFS